ncbi:hAT family C-terminal dimerization region, partial [Rhizoctonia solani]
MLQALPPNNTDFSLSENAMLEEVPTAMPTPLPLSTACVNSPSQPLTAIPTPLPHLTINSTLPKQKCKVNPSNSTPPSASVPSSSLTAICLRKQNALAWLDALERLANAYKAPPPTMRAPPPPVAKLQVSNARNVWYHQYPVRSKPLQLLTQSKINNLIPAVKKYQANMAFDQIQHPSLEYKALMCVCCLYNGATKYYINQEGGITGTICNHMKKAHPSKYYSKFMRKGLFDCCKDMPSNSLRTQTKFMLDGFINHLVCWVVVDDQAFNLLDVPEFCNLMLYVGHGRIKDSNLPHHDKLEALAEAMYQIKKDYVDKEMLSKALRRLISLTTHYVNELGLLRNHLIAFRKLNGHHSGINIGQSLHQVLQELGVAHKIGYITLDNASNNHTAMITLADKLSLHGITFSPKNNWIRCFPHILNLAVQTIIKSLGDSANRYWLSMESLNLAIGLASKQYLQALELQPIDACWASIAACWSSGTCCKRFESFIDTGNALGLFKHPDGTTMYPAITDFAFQMCREAIIPILDHSQYKVLQDLILILRIPYNAQEVLSLEKTPTLALAIPLFKTITWSWEQLATLMPKLLHAISCGIFKLQHQGKNPELI